MKLTDNQELWLTELESGKYKQYRGRMHSNDGKSHCCLGVAESIFVKFGEVVAFYKDANWYSKIGFSISGKDKCIRLNDKEKLSFIEIATRIRSDPEEYFSNDHV